MGVSGPARRDPEDHTGIAGEAEHRVQLAIGERCYTADAGRSVEALADLLVTLGHMAEAVALLRESRPGRPTAVQE